MDFPAADRTEMVSAAGGRYAAAIDPDRRHYLYLDAPDLGPPEIQFGVP
jgi:hypothetical protein